MTGPQRLAHGGLIDRSKVLRFSFDGKSYRGFAGDTLASALIANGVMLMGRSFKYHRPRGPIAAGTEEPNALVTIIRDAGRTTPNLRATEVELYDGLVARSQNRFPSLNIDVGALNGLIGRFIPAGFYYKTFMGPKTGDGTWLWRKVFEPVIRRAAGLGEAPDAPDPDGYAELYAHCEVLIVGSGEAGLEAALEASTNPANRVILCDEQNDFGGWLRNAPAGSDTARWRNESLAILAARPNMRMLARCTAFGYFAQNFVSLAERVTDHLARPDPALPRERLWKVRAKRVVLATGAIERPLVFPGNDRPGIILASAAETWLARQATPPGRAILVLTGCDSAYGAALRLAEAGSRILAILDLRSGPTDPHLAEAAQEKGIAVHTDATISDTEGSTRVTHATALRKQGEAWIGIDRFVCDTILMSGGWTPSVHLFSQSRGKLSFDAEREIFVPGEAAQTQMSTGACAGEMSRVMHGHWLGDCHTHDKAQARNKAFVDFQNDVAAADIQLAVREGFRSIEHVKRYTTTGMATDQGKTSNLNALAIAAKALGKSIPEVGLTTFRQPYTPVTFGSLAGAARGMAFDPVRQTPMHTIAEAHGAVFDDFGLWKRARYLPYQGEYMDAAVQRECVMVRHAAGLFDASTLGKIEVTGPDAARLLDQLYTIPVESLEPGRCRYGLMLNEAGFVIDDGIIARLAADRFHVTTTSSGAARVLNLMEDYLQTEFTDFKVWLTSTTEQWAVIAVQGPQSRAILAPFVAGFDISSAAMPHMTIREGAICGVPARVMRASFTGEMGYEINLSPEAAPDVLETLIAAGAGHGATLYGTEAMHVLRAEKGYIVVGQETDGTVTPDDLGLGWAIGKKKPFFVGKQGLALPDIVASGRKQLVGLLTEAPDVLLDEGAQLVSQAKTPPGTPALGHVTSSYRSATLKRSIALALVSDGRQRLGETLYVPMPDGDVRVTIVAPVFLDPKGERIHG